MDGAKMTPRPQQTTLVEIARKALNDEGVDAVKFIQAGTGTGKSFAVLATAFEASQMFKAPSVVVAPTNALVNQYVMKDAPRVQKILGGKFAYLKGRSTYLCTQSPEARKLKGNEAADIYNSHVKEGRFEWAQAGLQGWGCTGDCNPKFGDLCAMALAKEEAAKADVIVTNGHVLIWDLKVNQMTSGQANLLPAYGALFVDETHELDAVAKNCNSDAIGPNSEVYLEVLGLEDWVARKIHEMENAKPKQSELLVEIDKELAAMLVEANREAGRIENQLAGTEPEEQGSEGVKELRKRLKALTRFIGFATSEDDRFISTITLEPDGKGELKPSLNLKCVDASSWTRPILTQQPSVLVSGTIPPSLPARLGVRNATLSDVGTPFHYGDSVLAISPFSAKDFDKEENRQLEVARAVVDMAKRPHAQGGGGTLLLFTSWKDLDNVMPVVVKKLAEAGLYDIPVFAQSRDNQQETAEDLEKFKAHGHAVMGGVQSMWTGVDVPGPALRQVVIYRLPWGVPTLEVKAVEKKFGRQPYADDMMTRLVQGIGRLVRQVDDNGRVFIADSRAKSQRWGSNPMSKHVAQFSPFKRPPMTMEQAAVGLAQARQALHG